MLSQKALAVALATLPLVGGVTFASSPLIPLTSDGSAAIFFVADASATYNDNIFFQNSKTDDVIFTVSPGFELVAGGDGNSKFDLLFKEDLVSYLDNDNLNNQRANIDATYTYDAQQALKATIAAGFHQTAQATNQTNIAGDIVRTNNFYGKFDAAYRATEKSTITAGAGYNGTRYTNFETTFNDQDSFNIPLSWQYAVTDKLNAGFTYAYTHTNISPNSGFQAGLADGTQEVHFAGLTANGSVTEKLKLEANAGVGFSSIDTIDGLNSSDKEENTTFNFSLKSTYLVTEKLTATLEGGRNFGVGALGQQTTTTNGTFGLQYAIDEAWSTNASVGYMNQDFAGIGGGTDKIITASLGVGYQLNKYVKFGVNYAYYNDDTDRPGAQNFDNNTVAFTASVKY